MPKKYIPNEREKYMCEKQKVYFKKRLIEWTNEIIELNSKGLYLKEVDHEISSPDVVDQAASRTEKNVKILLMLTFLTFITQIYTSLCLLTPTKRQIYSPALNNYIIILYAKKIHSKQKRKIHV